MENSNVQLEKQEFDIKIEEIPLDDIIIKLEQSSTNESLNNCSIGKSNDNPNPEFKGPLQVVNSISSNMNKDQSTSIVPTNCSPRKSPAVIEEITVNSNSVDAPVKASVITCKLQQFNFLDGTLLQVKVDPITNKISLVPYVETSILPQKQSNDGPRVVAASENADSEAMRGKKKCPIEGCSSIVIDLSKHLQLSHKLNKEERSKIGLQMRLRKGTSKLRSCPICQAKITRPDKHLVNIHQIEKNSELYKKYVKKRSTYKRDAFEQQERKAKEKTVYSEYSNSITREFEIWLLTPPGGSKGYEDAKREAYKVRQIVNDFCEEDLHILGTKQSEGDECINDRKKDVRKKIEMWFDEYSITNSANSAKAYLYSFKTFILFLVKKGKYNFGPVLDILFKNLFKFLNRRAAEQSVHRAQLEISPCDLMLFETGEFFKKSLAAISNLKDRQTSTQFHTFARDFIALNILLHNDCGPCLVANLTAIEFESAQRVFHKKKKYFVANIANHQTVREGKARLAMPNWLFKMMKNYISFVRPIESIPYTFEGTLVDPFLTNHSGGKITSATVLSGVKSIWIAAGFTSNILSTGTGKLPVTNLHDYGNEIEKMHAVEHQTHSVSTASQYCKGVLNQAASGGELVHSAINGDIGKNKVSDQTSDSNCSSKDMLEPKAKKKKSDIKIKIKQPSTSSVAFSNFGNSLNSVTKLKPRRSIRLTQRTNAN